MQLEADRAKLLGLPAAGSGKDKERKSKKRKKDSDKKRRSKSKVGPARLNQPSSEYS